MVEQVMERWGVWVEHPDGRQYMMGDSPMTRWSRETAEGVAKHMNGATHPCEIGTYTAEALPVPPPMPKHGVWRDDESCFVVDAFNKTLEFDTRDEAVDQAKEWNDEDAEDWISQTGRGCYSARKLPRRCPCGCGCDPDRVHGDELHPVRNGSCVCHPGGK